MYLPHELSGAKVLVTVKTYPLPSGKYTELVCTAGLLDGRHWIRIYPVPFRFLQDDKKYPKYSWAVLDLVRNTSDFRPESYRPKRGLDEVFKIVGILGTRDNWASRKSYILDDVFESMQELISLAKSEQVKSLATLKPREIVGFDIEETDRNWKDEWLAQSKQGNLFDLTPDGKIPRRKLVRKLPYKYFYKFLTKGDDRPRRLAIEDWEIGALFWNCLRRSNGDEAAANHLVRQKYYDTFVAEKDLHFFVGTTLQYHHVAPNPFTIIGVFYPPKSNQLELF